MSAIRAYSQKCKQGVSIMQATIIAYGVQTDRQARFKSRKSVIT